MSTFLRIEMVSHFLYESLIYYIYTCVLHMSIYIYLFIYICFITLSISQTETPQIIYPRIVKLFFNNNESEIIFEEVIVAKFEVYPGIYVE